MTPESQVLISGRAFLGADLGIDSKLGINLDQAREADPQILA